MGKFSKEGSKYYFSTRSRGEIVAFETAKTGEELVALIEDYQYDIVGWSPREVLAELANSGLLEIKEEKEEQTEEAKPQTPGDFFKVASTKNGAWWVHRPTDTCCWFDDRVMEHRSAEWSDDRFHGKAAGGWERMKWRKWTEEDVKTHFETNPQEWGRYETYYHQGHRSTMVRFL